MNVGIVTRFKAMGKAKGTWRFEAAFPAGIFVFSDSFAFRHYFPTSRNTLIKHRIMSYLPQTMVECGRKYECLHDVGVHVIKGNLFLLFIPQYRAQ
jgi:hypothetical protein